MCGALPLESLSLALRIQALAILADRFFRIIQRERCASRRFFGAQDQFLVCKPLKKLLQRPICQSLRLATLLTRSRLNFIPHALADFHVGHFDTLVDRFPPMGIHIECEKCGQKYHLKDTLAGKKVKCKICRATFLVPAGGPVHVHEPRSRQFEPAIGDVDNIERISQHVEQHWGKIDTVYHEIISDLVHVDVHWVRPNANRPYHTFVTSGMSDRPMTVPVGAEDFRYGEVMLCLPADWKLIKEAFEEHQNYWPIELLNSTARFPHEYDTWVCFGHTITNGNPPKPYDPNARFCGCLISVPQLADKDFWTLQIDAEKTIRFYSVIPIYREEMDFKVKHGADPLIDKLCEQEITELLDVNRKNVCKRGWW